MRRGGWAAALVTVAIVTGLSAGAAATTQTAADDFSSGDFSGSTGTMPWASNWIEIGESDGPNEGGVRVQTASTCAAGPCLTITSLIGLLDLGARRSVDLTGAREATLSYHVDFPGGFLVSGSVTVQASADGGSWTTLASHGPSTRGVFTRQLPSGERLGIRFVTSGLSVGSTVGIDDVVVTATFPPPTTTTTSPTITPTTAVTTTTTTTIPRDATTTTRVPSDDPPPPGGPGPGAPDGTGGAAVDPLPPSETSGVVTDVSPSLGPTITAAAFQPREGFTVRFRILAEDVDLDLLTSAVLGVFLLLVSLRRLDRS